MSTGEIHSDLICFVVIGAGVLERLRATRKSFVTKRLRQPCLVNRTVTVCPDIARELGFVSA